MRWVPELSFPWSQSEFSEVSREAFERVAQRLDGGIRNGRNGESLFAVGIGVRGGRFSKVQFCSTRTVR